jgi:hypothetical protein
MTEFVMAIQPIAQRIRPYTYRNFSNIPDIERWFRPYVKALMEWDNKRAFFPDANLTLRVAYGKVAGYQYADGEYHLPQTTLEGIMEKDNPEIYDYNIPQRLRDVYAAKDYGRWGIMMNGKYTVPVCFIATNHTTGGNSGSPVINANGELIGVNFDRTWLSTMSDIEFDQNRIHVDHQLQRTSEMKYVIQEPKTEKGVRYVPMTDEVAMCFRRIIKNRKKPRKEPMIDGHAGFLCLDKNDMPMVALHWEKYMEHVVAKYNKTYRVQLPKITPHVCRHTFCSNMAKSGMNPKTLQYIMGHSDISVTLNTYTHVQFDDAKQELLRVAGR